ncbi:MAG: hypothetical protein R3A52_06780 [Polyangiales bacterium]
MELLPARNAGRPGDDPIFALNREATQRRAAGETVINATVGALLEDDGTLAVMPSVNDAIRAVPSVKASGYAPIAGVPDFLKAVIGDLSGFSARGTWPWPAPHREARARCGTRRRPSSSTGSRCSRRASSGAPTGPSATRESAGSRPSTCSTTAAASTSRTSTRRSPSSRRRRGVSWSSSTTPATTPRATR